MQVSFESSFDHWVAFQIFYTEKLQSLKRYSRKRLIRLVCWVVVIIVLINIIGYDAETFDPVSAMIPLLIFLGIFLWLICRNPFPRKALLRQFTVSSQLDFERIPDKGNTWQITDTSLIISCFNKQIHFDWDAIESITVCPQYLFIHFVFTDYGFLPAAAIDPAEYRPFCEHLVHTYQAHAAKAGKDANIIQSDWTIDMDALKCKSGPCSGKKLLFSLLWGVLFAIIFTLFCGLIMIALAVISVSLEEHGFTNSDTFAEILTNIWFFGSVLLLTGGIILGLNEKLPGTRTAACSQQNSESAAWETNRP